VIQENGFDFLIESEMGVPRVTPRTIELPRVGNVEGAMVNVGNPHFVLFVGGRRNDWDFGVHGMSWQKLGARISTSPLFPQGTNVEFVKVLSAHEIEFRIFERGCGPTTSSGTGTCASSAAAMALRGAARELTAIAEGGEQRTVWPANDAAMLLTGPAEIVCQGEAF
jgi:diaminopimelate epimerase